MRRAIELALLAELEGNLPVGAVITLRGEIVAEGRSAIWLPRFDATRHHRVSSSEMTLYTTLEPCLMCFGAILLHGIGRVVFGSVDSYGGSGSILVCLPPFFQVQFENIQWVGPMMPSECDPLHERLLALEEAQRGQVRGEDA